MRRLHIFATEIAGLTGRHQYQPVAEVAAKIRERFHGIAAPVAPYQAAANLLRSDRPVEPDATEDTLPDILPSVEKVTNQLQGEIDQLTTALKELPVPVDATDTPDDATDDALPPPDAEQRLALESELATKKEILRQVPTAATHVQRMDLGTVRENPVLQEIHRRLKPDFWDTSQPYQSLHIGDIDVAGETIAVYVGGRVDATAGKGADRYIVEVKNRSNRLFQAVPIYESCQIQAYLAIAGAMAPKPPKPRKKKGEPAPAPESSVVGAYWCQAFRSNQTGLQLEIKPPIKPNRVLWERITEELLRQAKMICLPPV